MKFTEALATFVMGMALVVVFSAILALPVWWLWNSCLVGAVTIVKEVDFMTAWGISLLCSFLFKPPTSSK
jgi:hypothetical protein